MGKWTSVHKGEISAFLQGERSRQQEQDQFQLRDFTKEREIGGGSQLRCFWQVLVEA